jgi:ABC-2 type transport system permease protein
MNKTVLIFKHEFNTMAHRAGFIIMTIGIPFLALIIIGGGQLFSRITAGNPPVENVKVGYVDMASIISGHEQQAGFNFVSYSSAADANKATLNKEIKEYIVIPPDYLTTGTIGHFTINRELQPPAQKVTAATNFLLDNLLAAKVQPDVLARAKAPINVATVILNQDTGLPAENQGGFVGVVLPYFFSILLVMAIFTSSGYLLQGLAEEKENRIMEVLLSSVSARELITGKVLGLGAAGLAQMAIWLVSARFLADLASTNFSSILGALEVTTSFVIFGLLYFILGYLLYAIIMAAVGSITSTVRESQQLATIFSLLAVSPLWGLVFLIENPNHPFAVFLSLFPFTAPITTIIRIGATEVPFWQIAASMSFMVITIVGLLFLSAKIFRAFLLMYGKTPKFGDIIRLLKRA